MFVLAPLLSPLLGDAYRESVEALRWLALLPILKCVHVTFGDALAGAGYQSSRAALQVFVAVFNVGVNFWLIAAFSWRGACWSSLASDGLLAALVLACMAWLERRESIELRKQPQLVTK
jgi:O-antigen/teichoic acid export membrane protein